MAQNPIQFQNQMEKGESIPKTTMDSLLAKLGNDIDLCLLVGTNYPMLAWMGKETATRIQRIVKIAKEDMANPQCYYLETDCWRRTGVKPIEEEHSLSGGGKYK